jgi:hypothetical protein
MSREKNLNLITCCLFNLVMELLGYYTLEGASAVSCAYPGSEDECVAEVEGDGWLDGD